MARTPLLKSTVAGISSSSGVGVSVGWVTAWRLAARLDECGASSDVGDAVVLADGEQIMIS